MTKTESRNAVEVDDLAWWDATDASDQDDELARAARLAPYSYESEQRTLVGIGPLGRARRSHPAAAPQAAPQSERMPQSEPPGPFIADDGESADDGELTAAPRGRRLGKRAVAICLALLVPLAAVGLLRRLAHPGELPRESARAVALRPVARAMWASASKSTAVAASPAVATSPAVAPDEAAEQATHEEPETQTPDAVRTTETDDAAAAVSRDPSGEHSRSVTAAEHGTNKPAPPSVKLAEGPSLPAVVDRSNGDSNAGTVKLMSTPPSSVVLDGRPLGKSPSVVRVPAGAHTLVFIHPLYGRRSLSINVRPGVTTAASTEF